MGRSECWGFLQGGSLQGEHWGQGAYESTFMEVNAIWMTNALQNVDLSVQLGLQTMGQLFQFWLF